MAMAMAVAFRRAGLVDAVSDRVPIERLSNLARSSLRHNRSLPSRNSYS